MRSLFPVTATLLLALASCEDPPDSPEQSRLSQSRSSWAALKSANGSSYRYTARDASFSGYRWQTTVEVLQDRVLRRTFRSETETGAEDQAWVEEGSALGSHAGAAPPLTIEGVYEECAAEVLTKDPGANSITVTFHSNGLLETCTYFPKNCADDCAVGVRVSSFEFLK